MFERCPLFCTEGGYTKLNISGDLTQRAPQIDVLEIWNWTEISWPLLYVTNLRNLDETKWKAAITYVRTVGFRSKERVSWPTAWLSSTKNGPYSMGLIFLIGNIMTQ